MSDKRKVEFTGTVERKVFGDTSDFRIFAVHVEEDEIKKSDLKKTKYGSVSIIGALHELGEGLDYKIQAVEEFNQKNGYSYRVLNITRDKPKNSKEFYFFLKDILTQKQANILWEAYPDIVQRIIEGRLDDIDLNKTKGIKDYTFNIIKRKIIDNYALAEIIMEFQGRLSMTVVRQIYEHYASVNAVKEALRRNPYQCLCSLSRVGFKKADSMLLELEKDKIIDFGFNLLTSKDRCLACIKYELEQNESDGHTQMDLLELRNHVASNTPQCLDKFVEALKEPDIYYDKDKLIVALKRTYDTEMYIAEEIKRRISLPVKQWDFDTKQYTNINGLELSDEQCGLLTTVCNNNFVVLTAPAGAGKSFSIKALINMIEDNNVSFTLASPTAKAAKKLEQYTERKAATIHRTLCYQGGEFLYNEDNPIITDVLLLDEVGMTDIKLFAQLLKAIPDYTKIVLVGDKFQLNSVGCGALLRDLLECENVPKVNYTKVFRMGEGGVLTVCTYIREGKKYIFEDKITHIGEDKSYTFIPCSKEEMNKRVTQLYRKLLETNEAKDITIISSYNVGENGCQKLNELLQPIANPKAKLNNPHMTIKSDKSVINFYVGDSVIQCSNNYHSKVYMGDMDCDEECLISNGDQGVIKEIQKNDIVIDFDGIEIIYSRNEMSTIKHSFAISVHKMQGSQNKIIIFCCPSSHTFMLNNNIVYTGVSRAEKMVYHFSDEHTLNVAMKKSDNKKRKTMLGDLLNTKEK